MKVDGERIRALRSERLWSQEQLAQVSGLNLRTIQRLEASANGSKESVKALAAVFEVPSERLLLDSIESGDRVIEMIKAGMRKGLRFEGRTPRSEFWWFALAVILVLAMLTMISVAAGSLPLHIASLLLLIPWIAACTRRLRDGGLSPWWQLISLVPVAGLPVLLYLLSLPSSSEAAVEVDSEL